MKLSKTIFEPITGSKKMYVEGKIHPIRVPMREINLSDFQNQDGTIDKNDPLTVYDTTGPFTDPNVKIDIYQGLQRFRDEWLKKNPDIGITVEGHTDNVPISTAVMKVLYYKL